jgi:hypothetical membrane protein
MSLKAKSAYVPGIAAATLLFLSWVVTATFYRGKTGEVFSPLNHFVSELGQTGVSRFAALFNSGIVIGGLFIIVFMVGLGFYIRKIPAYIGTAFGIIAAVAAVLIGFFPINHGSVHTTVSILFFFGALACVITFNLTIATDRSKTVSSWLIVPGFISFGLFSLLILAILAEPSPTAVLNPAIAVRPEVWMTAILEWLACLSLIAWVLSFSIYLRRKTAKMS